MDVAWWRPVFGHTGQPPDTGGANCARSRRDRLAEILIAPQRMLPRQVLPQKFYLITRRWAHRQFLLRLDPVTNNAFLSPPIGAVLREDQGSASSSATVAQVMARAIQ